MVELLESFQCQAANLRPTQDERTRNNMAKGPWTCAPNTKHRFLVEAYNNKLQKGYVYMCIHIYRQMYIYTYAYAYIRTCIYVYIHVPKDATCMYPVKQNAHMYIYIYTYEYSYTRIYTCIHI